MALQTAKMVAQAMREIERRLGKRHRKLLFAQGPTSERSYYRYKRGDESPTVEMLYRFAQFVDAPFAIRAGAYTRLAGDANAGGTLGKHEASVIAEMADLSESDKEHIAHYVQRYAALRREQPSEPPPARASGSRVAKAK